MRACGCRHRTKSTPCPWQEVLFSLLRNKKARSKRDRASCKAFHDSASVMWQNQGTELGVSDLSCLSRHHSDQLAGLLTRFRRRRTRRRTLCPFIDLTLLYMPRRQKASTIFSFRRNGRHSTVENGLTQKGTGFIGLLKILSYAKPVIPRPVRRLVVGIRSLFAGFLFRSDGCFSFVGNGPRRPTFPTSWKSGQKHTPSCQPISSHVVA